MINVILMERIEKLGKLGDVVKVKPGYARNFLLPQRKALRATANNLVIFEKQRTEIEAQQKDVQSKAEFLASNIEGKEIILIRSASESAQLYGSVTSRDISNEIQVQLEKQVMRNQIILETPIKTLGIFKQKLRLHGNVTSWIELNIAKTKQEAISQREAIIFAAEKALKKQEAKNKREEMAKKPSPETEIAKTTAAES